MWELRACAGIKPACSREEGTIGASQFGPILDRAGQESSKIVR
jgi:hypothetical protein